MKILLTGASSFTGLYFAKALAQKGHKVIAALSAKNTHDYQEIRAVRVRELHQYAEIVTDAGFGSANFLRLLKESGCEVLCHHAAEVRDYKNPDFNFIAATAKNCDNIREVFRIAKEIRLQSMVLTCSVFEANMGLGNDPMRAFSPYGLSKTLTREIFSYFAVVNALPLKLFAIPNPFGPYEEPRFVNYLVQNWRKGETPTVNTPLYIRDNIPVDLLSLAYVECVEDRSSQMLRRFLPQGYVESQGAFAERVAREFSHRMGVNYQVKLAIQKDFAEPIMRVNSENARLRFTEWNEEVFWGMYFEYYRNLLTA